MPRASTDQLAPPHGSTASEGRCSLGRREALVWGSNVNSLEFFEAVLLLARWQSQQEGPGWRKDITHRPGQLPQRQLGTLGVCLGTEAKAQPIQQRPWTDVSAPRPPTPWRPPSPAHGHL